MKFLKKQFADFAIVVGCSSVYIIVKYTEGLFYCLYWSCVAWVDYVSGEHFALFKI